SAINSSEHFAITYQATDVLLTVMSGPASANTAVTRSRASAGQLPLLRSDLQPVLASLRRPAIPAAMERSSSRWPSSGLPSAEISSLPQTSASARLGLSLPAASTHVLSAVNAGAPRPRASGHGKIGSKGASGIVQFSLLHPLSMPAFFL